MLSSVPEPTGAELAQSFRLRFPEMNLATFDEDVDSNLSDRDKALLDDLLSSEFRTVSSRDGMVVAKRTKAAQRLTQRGQRIEGLPVAVTLHGRLFDEGTLCRIGMALEEKFGVAGDRPPL